MDFSEFWEKESDRLIKELSEFLRIKSISTDPTYAAEMQKAQKWLITKLESLGFKTKQLLPPNPSKGKHANPVIWAEYTTDPKAETIMIYGHYDVQPADPEEKWKTPPFEPTIKDGKIYARGANDNKGQIFANIIAAEYYIKYAKKKKFNLKFFIEGEEETTGLTTDEAILSRRFDEELKTTYFWISDGPWIAKDKPTIVYALRGLVYYDLKIQTSKKDLHSGSYGNAVMNPGNLAGYIIFKLKDILRNRIRIPKLYKKVRRPSKYELDLVSKASPTWDEILAESEAYVATRYKDFPPLSLTGLMPSLDVHGINTGYTQPGGIKTVIPHEATIKFSIRLVPYLSPDEVTTLLEKYLGQIIPKGVKWELIKLGTAEPFIMDPKDPAVEKLLKVMSEAFGKPAVLVPEGGSIGLVNTMAKTYNPKILMPNYGLPDDGLHAPNEKFDIKQLRDGAKCLVGFLEG